MTAPTSWPECAERLGTPVRSFEEHARRWRESLKDCTQSSYSLHFRADLDRSILIGYALDAAAGVAFATERLQRSCLGPLWEQRTTTFDRLKARRPLPVHPPPGCGLAEWAALKKIMEEDLADEQAVVAACPEELHLLRNLESRRPQEFDRLLDAAETAGARVDAGRRERAVGEAAALVTSEVLRNAWVDTFGKARIWPNAPFHLAVVLLHQVFPRTRPKSLFLQHCGLTQGRLGDLEGLDRRDALNRLDDEVNTSLKRWGLAGERPGCLRVALRLCDIIELVTHEELRAASSPDHPARDSA